MTPKQQTMHEICDMLDADAKKDGMGLDREMFTKKHMRLTHAFLLAALANMKRRAAPPVEIGNQRAEREGI